MDPQQRQVLFEMAKYWLKIADKAERGEDVSNEISPAPVAAQLRAKSKPRDVLPA
jgi:hypothetical protein